MLKGLIAIFFEKLIEKLLELWIKQKKGKEQKVLTEQEIDEKLEEVKQAHKEAFNGTDITPEQNKALRQTIIRLFRDRSNSNGGL